VGKTRAMTTFIKKIILFLIVATFAIGQTADGEAVDSSSVKSPGKALLFSFVPGGGQLYNQSPWKALLFAGVFSYFSYEYLNAENDYKADPLNGTLHRVRNDKIWLMGLTWTLNIIDAYVEAQLWDFDQYEIDAESLPDTEIIKPKETEETNDTE
jgi:hypothetical protein